MPEALFRASPSPSKRLLKVDGAGHNNLMAVSLQKYMEAIATLVNEAIGSENPGSE